MIHDKIHATWLKKRFFKTTLFLVKKKKHIFYSTNIHIGRLRSYITWRFTVSYTVVRVNTAAPLDPVKECCSTSCRGVGTDIPINNKQFFNHSTNKQEVSQNYKNNPSLDSTDRISFLYQRDRNYHLWVTIYFDKFLINFINLNLK